MKMKDYSVEHIPLLKPKKDWRLRDYRIRILNKLNKGRWATGEKFLRLSDVEILLKKEMKKRKLGEFETLFAINRELLLKEMADYGNKRTKSC